MKLSNEELSNGKGYERINGWNRLGYCLVVEPDHPEGIFVGYGHDKLHHSNLLSIHGEGLTKFARQHHWSPEKLEDEPGRLERFFESRGDNLIVPQDVTVEFNGDNRGGAAILYGKLPLLEIAGVRIEAIT